MKIRTLGSLIFGVGWLLASGCASRELEQSRIDQTNKIQALQRKTEDLQHALEAVNRAREDAEAVKGGLEDQVRNLQEDLDRMKRARETAEAAGTERELRVRALQRQLQTAERERDQSKAALAGRQRPGAGKSGSPKKPPQAPAPQSGKDQKPE
jgi:TolA-binding protein